jgi:hypothetical protein
MRFGSSTTQERTEETYVYWIRRFILFHNKHHPQEMVTPEVTVFLTKKVGFKTRRFRMTFYF